MPRRSSPTLEGMASAEEREKYTRYFAPDPDAPFIGVRMGAVFELAKTALDLPAPSSRRCSSSRRTRCGRSPAASWASPRRTDAPPTSGAPSCTTSTCAGTTASTSGTSSTSPRATSSAATCSSATASPLARLAASGFWPERRTALVATFAFLKRGEVDDAFALAETLADDPEPLVQKALGWVLRAAGDLDRERLTAFVERHAATMPRVALRAAIEHYSKDERARILAIR